MEWRTILLNLNRKSLVIVIRVYRLYNIEHSSPYNNNCILLYIFHKVLRNPYPVEIWPSEWVECGVNGGTGEPLESSDGVFENKLPPNSETKVMGELIFVY